MIQIQDWIVVAVVLAFFLSCIFYLLYFIISKKLFPETAEFQKEINANDSATVLSLKGSGIIKKIETQITQTDNSSTVLIVDRTAYSTLNLVIAEKNQGHVGFDREKNKVLNFEVNLDRPFREDFSVFIENRSTIPINASGRIFCELKKPLGVTLRSLFS